MLNYMMLKFVAEFLGTFVFVSVILYAVSKSSSFGSMVPVVICAGLLLSIYMTAEYSGGHLNPAVSTVMYLNKSLDLTNYGGYVTAQLLGAAAAWYVKTNGFSLP